MEKFGVENLRLASPVVEYDHWRHATEWFWVPSVIKFWYNSIQPPKGRLKFRLQLIQPAPVTGQAASQCTNCCKWSFEHIVYFKTLRLLNALLAPWGPHFCYNYKCWHFSLIWLTLQPASTRVMPPVTINHWHVTTTWPAKLSNASNIINVLHSTVFMVAWYEVTLQIAIYLFSCFDNFPDTHVLCSTRDATGAISPTAYKYW